MRPWPRMQLGAVCSVTAGGTPSRSRPDFYGGAIPWVKIGDMLQGRILATEETITEVGLKNSSAKLLPADTVLVSIFATIGRTAVLGVNAATNQAIAGITPHNTELLLPQYLRRFLDSVVADLQSKARGVAQVNINSRILKSLEIPLPPIDVQREILSMLDRADALRVKRRQAIVSLEELAKSIFLEMFGDPMTNPQGWTKRSIAELGSVTTGNTPPRSDTYNYGHYIEWIKSDNINPSEIIVSHSSEMLSEQGARLARIANPDSLLVTCIAGSPNSIGNVALTDRRVAFNQQINAFTPQSINPLYAYMHLKVGKRLVQNESTGGMKGLVSKSRFGGIQLMVPPKAIQRSFADTFEQLTQHIDRGRESQTALDELFESLQASAFRWEL